MTLIKRSKRIWHYDFRFNGQRYQGSTQQTDRDDAAFVEAQIQQRIRRQAHGVPPRDAHDSPTLTTFAALYLKQQRLKLSRPDVLERTLRMVLAFWGTRPRTKAVPWGVYHDLRLLDPILTPAWLDRFDAWIDTRRLAGSTRNSYRSALSGIYALAMRPRYRPQTGVERNPFADVPRHPTRARCVTTSRDELVTWMAHAPPHLVLAIVIGALAPKLRLQQVLGLRFDVHLDRDLARIVYEAHKTRRHTRAPQITHVSEPLRRVLEAVRTARPESRHVITWRGKPISSIRTAAKRAAKDAGLAYGRQDGAVTFHALRHVAATEIARMGVAALVAGSVLGHRDARTTEKHYTHLLPSDEVAAMEALGLRLDLADAGIVAVGDSVESQARTDHRARGKRAAEKRRLLKAVITVTR